MPVSRHYPATFYEDDAKSFEALLSYCNAAPAHLIGWSTGGEIALLIAARTPNIARSMLTWGAAGMLNDPDGQVRGIMNNLVDHPIPPWQQYSLKCGVGQGTTCTLDACISTPSQRLLGGPSLLDNIWIGLLDWALMIPKCVMGDLEIG